MLDTHIQYSVVIPVYGASTEQLARVLISLSRQSVEQSTFEVLIADDGTPIARRADYGLLETQFSNLHLRVLYAERNRGPAAARNIGLRAAAGGITFFTDDDCELPATWMESHLRVYRTYPNVSAVGGWYESTYDMRKRHMGNTMMHLWYSFIFSPVRPLQAEGFHYAFPFLQFPAINTANLSVRTGVAQLVGGFDERFFKPGSEDTEFSLRLRRLDFIMYALAKPVYHTKRITLSTLWSIGKNRAAGMYVLNMLMGYRAESMFGSFREYVFKHHIYQAYPRWKRVLFLIHAFLFVLPRHPLLMWIQGVRWRRAMHRRLVR